MGVVECFVFRFFTARAELYNMYTNDHKYNIPDTRGLLLSMMDEF